MTNDKLHQLYRAYERAFKRTNDALRLGGGDLSKLDAKSRESFDSAFENENDALIAWLRARRELEAKQ